MNKDKGKNSCGCRMYGMFVSKRWRKPVKQVVIMLVVKLKFKAWKNYVITKYILYSLDCLSNKILQPVQKRNLYFYYLLFPVLV